MATPRRIYHVVQNTHWSKAQKTGEEYFPPTYDADGFIHATHDPKLLIDVLNHFYQDIDDTFICLEIDTTKLTSKVKMERPAPVGKKEAKKNDDETKFPHIYGPIKPLSCVTKQMSVVRDEKGKFLQILGL